MKLTNQSFNINTSEDDYSSIINNQKFLYQTSIEDYNTYSHETTISKPKFDINSGLFYTIDTKVYDENGDEISSKHTNEDFQINNGMFYYGNGRIFDIRLNKGEALLHLDSSHFETQFSSGGRLFLGCSQIDYAFGHNNIDNRFCMQDSILQLWHRVNGKDDYAVQIMSGNTWFKSDTEDWMFGINASAPYFYIYRGQKDADRTLNFNLHNWYLDIWSKPTGYTKEQYKLNLSSGGIAINTFLRGNQSSNETIFNQSPGGIKLQSIISNTLNAILDINSADAYIQAQVKNPGVSADLFINSGIGGLKYQNPANLHQLTFGDTTTSDIFTDLSAGLQYINYFGGNNNVYDTTNKFVKLNVMKDNFAYEYKNNNINTKLTLKNQQLDFSTSYYLDGTSDSNIITDIHAELSPLYYMNSGQHKVLSTTGDVEMTGNGGHTLGIMSSSINLYRYSDNRLSLYGAYTSYQDGQECWNFSGGATYGMLYDSKGYNHIVKNNDEIVYNVSSTDYNYSVYQMARSIITVNSAPNYGEYLANPKMYISIFPGVDDPAYLFYKGNAYDYGLIFNQDLINYNTDFWYQRYLGKISYSLSGAELLMKAQDITIPNVTQLEGQKFGGELSISPITGIKYYFGLYTDGSNREFDETYSLELIPNRMRVRKSIKTETGSSYYYPLNIRLGTSGSSLYIGSDDNKGFSISDREFSSYFNSDDLTYKYSFGKYGFEITNYEVRDEQVQCNSLLKYTDWNKYSGIIHKDEMEFYLENNAPLLGYGLKSTLTFSGSNVINDPSTGPNMTWRTQTNVNYFEEGCNITNYNLSDIQFESVFNNKYKQIRLSTKLIDLNNIHEYIPGLSIENIDKNNNNYGTLITVYSDKITFRNEQRTATTGSYSDNTTIIEQTYLQYRPSNRYVSTTMPEGYKMDGNTWIINANGAAQFEDIQIKKSDGTFVSLRDIIDSL